MLHIAENCEQHINVANAAPLIVKFILSPVDCREFINLYNIRLHVQYTCTYLICVKYFILDKLSKIIRV